MRVCIGFGGGGLSLVNEFDVHLWMLVLDGIVVHVAVDTQ